MVCRLRCLKRLSQKTSSSHSEKLRLKDRVGYILSIISCNNNIISHVILSSIYNNDDNNNTFKNIYILK